MKPSEIASRFSTARRTGNRFVAPCQLCGYDLSIGPGKKASTVIHCHGGCDAEDVLKAKGLTWADLNDPSEATAASTRKAGHQPLTIWEFAKEKGLPLKLLNRNGVRQAGGGVMFTYYTPDFSLAQRHHLRVAMKGNSRFRWTGTKADGDIIPYGLEHLGCARKKGGLVIDEGESDVLALRYHGITGIGIPGVEMLGKTLRPEYLEGIDRVFIVREPDEAGVKFVEAVAARLRQFHWRGTAMVLNFTKEVEDPSELHRQTLGYPEEFRARWAKLVENAETLKLVDNAEIVPSGSTARSCGRTENKPIIRVVPGTTPAQVTRVEEIILANYARWGLYQRAGLLMRIATAPPAPTTPQGIRRPEGSVILVEVTTAMLEDIFTQAVDFKKETKHDGEKSVDCPSKVARIYESRKGRWRLPYLIAVIEAPTITPDGTLLITPGYDEQTGLLLHTAIDWQGIPDQPTKAQCEDAMRILLEPLREFPFVSEADRSVAIAAILTALTRSLLPAAPLHGFSAPTRASGKSLLADLVAIIATGRDVPSMPAGGDAEEMRKRVTSVLLDGYPVVNIDNITKPLDSDALAMVLTQETFSDRLLGKNLQLRLPTNVTWMATGNNLILTGDLTTRGLVSRIDAGMENPEERVFQIPELLNHVRRNRVRLVQAALTVLRGYHVAGRPKQDVKQFGRFEAWSNTVREPLVWVGLPDPCQTRERLAIDDPGRTSIRHVLGAWYAFVQDQILTLKELCAKVQDESAQEAVDEIAKLELRDALLEVGAAKTNPIFIDTRTLAAWCRENLDRVAGGVRLTRLSGKRHNATLWRVVKVEG